LRPPRTRTFLFVTIKPKCVVKEDGDISIVEVWQYVRDRPRKIVGYYVYGGRGDPDVLHPTREAAEIEFLRRTWVT